MLSEVLQDDDKVSSGLPEEGCLHPDGSNFRINKKILITVLWSQMSMEILRCCSNVC